MFLNSSVENRHLGVSIDALRAELLILKAQICVRLQTRALAFMTKQILEAYQN